MLLEALHQVENGLSLAGKTLNIALFAAGNIFLSGDALVSLLVSLFGIVALVWYETHRKFKREAVQGLWDFIDRNFVRLILAGAILPNGFAAIVAFLEALK